MIGVNDFASSETARHQVPGRFTGERMLGSRANAEGAARPNQGLDQIQEKWTPVFRPDLRQNKDLERLRDSTNRESALGVGWSREGVDV